VFANQRGRGLDHRHVGDAFRTAVRRSGVTAADRLSLHSLRHGYASLLIAQGLNVVFVSRQLGHANANITLGVYAHLYARADHAETARAAIEASHAQLASGCNA
jgi:integrase